MAIVYSSAHRLEQERDVSPAVTASTPDRDRETLHVAFSRQSNVTHCYRQTFSTGMPSIIEFDH